MRAVSFCAGFGSSAGFTLVLVLDITTCAVGIFGKVAELDAALQPGDHVEIYRAITADPASVPRRVSAGEDAD